MSTGIHRGQTTPEAKQSSPSSLMVVVVVGGGGGDTGANFCLVCAAGLSEPLPHYSLLCGQTIDSILVAFGKK